VRFFLPSAADEEFLSPLGDGVDLCLDCNLTYDIVRMYLVLALVDVEE